MAQVKSRPKAHIKLYEYQQHTYHSLIEYLCIRHQIEKRKMHSALKPANYEDWRQRGGKSAKLSISVFAQNDTHFCTTTEFILLFLGGTETGNLYYWLKYKHFCANSKFEKCHPLLVLACLSTPNPLSKWVDFRVKKLVQTGKVYYF